MKDLAAGVGDALGRRVVEDAVGVDGGEPDPEHVTARRRRPPGARGHVPGQRVQHRALALGVETTHATDVAGEDAAPEECGERRLGNGSRREVGAHPSQHHLLEQRTGGDDETHAERREEHLRERPGMDHLPRVIEPLQRRNRRPVEAELAVVVVLEDRHLVLVGEREELAAAGVAHHRSRGALRRRCRVDELHPPRLEHAGQLRGLEPLLVDPDADKVRLARREGERGAEVSRLLHHHRVTGIDERVRRGVDSLLGSVHHGDVARLARPSHRDVVQVRLA